MDHTRQYCNAKVILHPAAAQASLQLSLGPHEKNRKYHSTPVGGVLDIKLIRTDTTT